MSLNYEEAVRDSGIKMIIEAMKIMQEHMGDDPRYHYVHPKYRKDKSKKNYDNYDNTEDYDTNVDDMLEFMHGHGVSGTCRDLNGNSIECETFYA